MGQLKQKYSGLVSDVYQSFGFPTLTLDAEVNTDENSEEYAKFLADKQKEDESRAFEALVEMQKKEAEKSSDGVFHRSS